MRKTASLADKTFKGLMRLVYFIKQYYKKKNKASLYFLVYGAFHNFYIPKIRKQKYFLSESDWDVLIILDACRYDFFKREYEKYLHGKLVKTYSPASGTASWLKKVFNGHYENVQIFSSNPRINSKGVKISGYKATDHFAKDNIIDIWEYGWNEKLSTVTPDVVVSEYIKHKDLSKKHIVWFLQPHGPWIGEHPILTTSSEKFEGHDEAVIRLIRGGRIKRETLKIAYRDNLRLVLKNLKILIENIGQDQKIIITSDHGELLGEHNSYLHFSCLSAYKLREVPLLFLNS